MIVWKYHEYIYIVKNFIALDQFCEEVYPTPLNGFSGKHPPVVLQGSKLWMVLKL